MRTLRSCTQLCSLQENLTFSISIFSFFFQNHHPSITTTPLKQNAHVLVWVKHSRCALFKFVQCMSDEPIRGVHLAKPPHNIAMSSCEVWTIIIISWIDLIILVGICYFCYVSFCRSWPKPDCVWTIHALNDCTRKWWSSSLTASRKIWPKGSLWANLKSKYAFADL